MQKSDWFSPKKCKTHKLAWNNHKLFLVHKAYVDSETLHVLLRVQLPDPSIIENTSSLNRSCIQIIVCSLNMRDMH
jgi:hypothetical protein